jgi:hypothetical protein
MIQAQGRALIPDPMYGEYHYLPRTVMGLEAARFDLAKGIILLWKQTRSRQ